MAKIVTLGEIMMRLSTTAGTRLFQTEQFSVHYGGAEANVAVSLANFGHHVFFASKVPENPLGNAVKKHLQKYGVHTDYLLTGGKRLGTYYVEAGVGNRGTQVVYDRTDSSFAEVKQLQWPKTLFKEAELFHISGITPALSKEWEELTLALIKQAKAEKCKVSFDINYRSKLWSQKEASESLKKILPYVDYCSAGALDARYLLNVPKYQGEDQEALPYYYQQMQKQFPNISVFYSTKRKINSASANRLQGTYWTNDWYYESDRHQIEPIVDRIGGGDAFSAGILHGILTKQTPQSIVDFATAASVLKHTVSGDCNQFTEAEVKQYLALGSKKIVR